MSDKTWTALDGYAGQQYFGTREVARILGRSQVTIRQWMHNGTLPSCRLRSRLLVTRAALEAFLRKIADPKENQA